MTRLYCLTAAILLLSSCALAQRGTLRGERVIITNQDASVYPPNDFQIRNAALGSRVQIGINASDRAVSSYFNENDNLALELDTTEGVAMFRILADSPNANKITGGVSTGGTALDTGYFQVLGEDRASGLDAYTAINGGDIDTNTVLVRTTNASPGYVQWDDTTGTGSLVSLFGYNGGSAASYSLYWPAASYATSSCGGTCVIEIDDSTGQMSFAAPSGGGGGSPGGVTDEIQLNDGAGGFNTVTGFKHDGTTFTIPGNVATSADSTYSLGTNTVRFGTSYTDVAYTELIGFRYQGSGSNNFSMGTLTPGTELRIYDSAGASMMLFQAANIQSYKNFQPVITSTLTLGSSGSPWDLVYGNTYTVNTAILPDTSAGATVGSSSLLFDGYFDDVNVYTQILPDTNGGADIGSSSLRFANIRSWSYDVGTPSALPIGLLNFYQENSATPAILAADDFSGSTDLTVTGHFEPFSNNTYQLGLTSKRWSKVWTVDLDVSGTCTGCGGGGLPVVDTTSIVEGSGDATKELRLEVDGVTTGTTRIWTVQNTNLTVAGIDVAQTWTATQTTQALTPSANATYDLGTSGARYDDVWFDTLDASNTRSLIPVTSTTFALGSTSFLWNDLYTVNIHAGASAANTGIINIYNASTAGNVQLTSNNLTGGVDMQVNTNFYPSAAATYNLGLQTRRWGGVYTGEVNASTGYRGPANTLGTTTTLTCGTGLAVKNITIDGGVVLSASCGAP